MVTAASAANAQATAPSGDSSAFNWTGPYVGTNFGGDINRATRFDRTTGALPNNTTALTLGLRPVGHAVIGNSLTGGAQVGYNWELGNRFRFGGAHTVIGAETDAEYMGARRTDTLSNTTLYGPLDTLGTTPTMRVNEYQSGLDFLGTVRGRVGVAYNTSLLYLTGGYAYGDVQRRETFYGPNASNTPYFTGASNGVKSGYTYGAGVEIAVPTDSFLNRLNVFHSSGVTIKAEYLHYDLGSDTVSVPGVNGGATIGGYASRVRTDGNTLRAGLNYKF
jgi:outer membrane immunogenic protein